VAVAGEAELERQRGEIALAVTDALKGERESQLQEVAVDRHPLLAPEAAGEVEGRAAERVRHLGEGMFFARRAGEALADRSRKLSVAPRAITAGGPRAVAVTGNDSCVKDAERFFFDRLGGGPARSAARSAW
jgi:hypothetical protein